MQEFHVKKDIGDVRIPVREKYMLTIKEASMYFSIGVRK